MNCGAIHKEPRGVCAVKTQSPSQRRSPIARAARRATPALVWALGLAALVLALPPAAADTSLVERGTPFVLPQTFSTPHAYLADAAGGTNGTAHLIVTSAAGAYYLWVNSADGTIIESVNLTEKGFDIDVYDYWYYYYTNNPPSYDFRFAIIESRGSRVMISHAFSFAGVDLMFFDEGGAADAARTRAFFPQTDPGPGYETWDFTSYSFMPNAEDGSRPSLLWARNSYSNTYGNYYERAALEVGRIDVDFTNGSVGSPYTVALLRNTTGASMTGYYYYYSGTYADQWRLQYETSAMGGVINETGAPSIFAVTLQWYCTQWYSYTCYDWRAAGNWTLIGPGGTRQSLADVTPYIYSPYYSSAYAAVWSYTDVIAAPNGSVAAFLTMPGNSSAIVFSTELREGTPTTTFTDIGGYPPVGAEAYLDGASVNLLVSDIVNGTPTAHGRLREIAGWPGALTTGHSWAPSHPLESLSVLEGGANPKVVGGALEGLSRVFRQAAPSVFWNVSFERTWPLFSSLGASGTTNVEMSSWQEAGAATVLDSAVVTLPNGAQAGMLVTNENGTGIGRALFATGSPPVFTLGDPLDVQGNIRSARVILQRGVAVVVVQVIFQTVNGTYGWGGSDYLMFTIGPDGTASALTSIYEITGADYDYGNPVDWRLMEAEPKPIMWTSMGIYFIDPWNATATLRIQMGYYDYSSNQTKLVRSNETIIGSPSWIYYGCSYYYGYCGFPFTAWTEGSDLLFAYVVANYTGTYQNAYTSAPVLRLARWFSNNTVLWRDFALFAARADDLMVAQTTAEFRHRINGTSTVEVYLMFRQLDMWERLYRLDFARGSGNLVSSGLVRQDPQRTMGGYGGGLATFKDGVALLQARDAIPGAYYVARMDILGAYTENVTGVEDYDFPIRFVNCSYYAYYYYYYGSYYYWGCGRWSAFEWEGALAILLYDDERARFFAPNHEPTAPRLLTPANGTKMGRLDVLMTVTPSADVDLDPLVYRFIVYDGFGRIVVDQNISDTRLNWKLPDGNYTWTVWVTDGFVWVQSPDVFRLDIDGSPPFAEAGGPYNIGPGDGVLLNASGSYDAGGIRIYKWTIGGEGGIYFESAAPTLALTWEQLEPFFAHGALISVSLTVEDIFGLTASDGTMIALRLEPIVLDGRVLTPGGVEGSPIELVVNATWGGFHYNWDDGTALGHLTIAWDFPDGTHAVGLHVWWTPPDSGALVVNITAVMGSGSTGYQALPLAVANLPPSATGEGPKQFAEGEFGTFTITAGDPSPIDNASLTVTWRAEGGVALLEQAGFTARLRGATNGQATLRALIEDKDGGQAEVVFEILVSEYSDPVGGVWAEAVGSTWVKLRWTTTAESDFVRYEILVRSKEGKLLLSVDAGEGARSLDLLVVTGLTPSTEYTFEVVVVALGEVRSPPVGTTAKTAPPEVAPVPPTENPPPPPKGGPPTSPNAPPPETPNGVPNQGAILTTAPGGSPALALLLVAAAAVAALLYLRSRRGRQDLD